MTDDGALPLPSSDEERRKLLKPNPAIDDILRVIHETYGGGGQKSFKVLKELDSYDDSNFLVEETEKEGAEGARGRVARYLLKVHNGVESDEYVRARDWRRRRRKRRRDDGTEKGDEVKDDVVAPTSVVDLQNSIFRHLSRVGGVVTSSPVPLSLIVAENDSDDVYDSDDAVSLHLLPVSSPLHSPHRLAVRLLTFVPGTTLSSMPRLPIETFAEVGRYLGRLDAALDTLPDSDPGARQAAVRYHAWDGRNALDLRQFVGCIDDEGRRALVTGVLEEFESVLGKGGAGAADGQLRFGINHGDMNDANILMDEGGTGKVSGVIDFGDSTYSWRVLDVAVAAAYAMISSYGKRGRSLSAAAALIRGYHSAYPLERPERAVLRLLIESRLACSVSLGAYSYKQNPGNQYLLFHAEPAWKALELLRGAGDKAKLEQIHGAVDSLFDAACDNYNPSGTGKEEETDISCSDISLPDPHAVDWLHTVRLKATVVVDDCASGAAATNAAVPEEGHVYASDALPTVTFVTGNKKKLEEVKRILAAGVQSDGSGLSSSGIASILPFVITNHKVDLPELQGDPVEIAREKCILAAREIGGAVITEDTSLCFNALKGLPGPYIKWFLDKCGHNGLNDMISFTQDKSGYAQTCVAFCPGPGKEVVVFDGRTRGKIVRPRGSLDFGWDPIFEPEEGGGKTYAEMSKAAKDAISHRSRAFAQLRQFLIKEEKSVRQSIQENR